jgi:hypothetical protein
LLTFALILAGLSLAVAVFAVFTARATAAKAERLTESYWELRYEIGQLKVRANRLESAAGPPEPDTAPERAAVRSESPVTFVPLSSLKK